MVSSVRRTILAACVAVALAGSPGCSRVMGLVNTPDAVQVTVLAEHALDQALQLGELVEQLRSTAHKLAVAKVLPLEADNVIQRAAIAFADAKDVAVRQMAVAQTPLQVQAAAAPMVGAASTITTLMQGVSGVGALTGTAGLLSDQLPATLEKTHALIKQLGGR